MERENSAGGFLRLGGAYFRVVITSVLLVLRLPSLDAATSYDNDDSDSFIAECLPLNSSFCRPYALYNNTVFPNFAGKTSPEEAEADVTKYWWWVESNCSELLGPLLCAVYFPKCQDFMPVLPCRSSCESVKKSCGEFVESAGFLWPEALDCDQLPLEVVGGASPTCLKLTGSRGDVLVTTLTPKDTGTSITVKEANSDNRSWPKSSITLATNDTTMTVAEVLSPLVQKGKLS